MKYIETSHNALKFFLYHFHSINSNFLRSFFLKHGELITQSTPKKLSALLCFFKKHSLTQFQNLIDIAVYDEPTKKHRFTVVYLLLSIKFNLRLQITIKLHVLQNLTSVTNLFKSAFWVEREIWDLYGIFFSKHFDLRRILTDYNFSGHPLRKDFPLSGYIDLFYDDKLKRIVYVPIEITQEYRNFNFQSPWK